MWPGPPKKQRQSESSAPKEPREQPLQWSAPPPASAMDLVQQPLQWSAPPPAPRGLCAQPPAWPSPPTRGGPNLQVLEAASQKARKRQIQSAQNVDEVFKLLVPDGEKVDLAHFLSKVASLMARGLGPRHLPSKWKVYSFCTGSGCWELVTEAVASACSEKHRRKYDVEVMAMAELVAWKQRFLQDNIVQNSQTCCLLSECQHSVIVALFLVGFEM
jgi:hypothetical protein